MTKTRKGQNPRKFLSDKHPNSQLWPAMLLGISKTPVNAHMWKKKRIQGVWPHCRILHTQSPLPHPGLNSKPHGWSANFPMRIEWHLRTRQPWSKTWQKRTTISGRCNESTLNLAAAKLQPITGQNQLFSAIFRPVLTAFGHFWAFRQIKVILRC